MANFSRDPWQDPVTKITTVPALKALEASEVFQGFLGSWAAGYVTNNGMMNDISTSEGGMPAQPKVSSSHLGQPGFPEINFVPYAHGTNRFGPKGGALLGHPISFSIIGPTLKRGSKVNWQWVVTDNSATPGVGDIIELDDFLVLFHAVPSYPALVGNISDRYGVSSLTDCPDGLYLTIPHPGGPGTLEDSGIVSGGVGGGSIWQKLADPTVRYGLVPKTPFSTGEIFRVVDITGTQLTLDPNKRLADYFTFHAPGAGVLNNVRGITLMEPKATRLLAVPDSGTGKGLEQTFVVVPPVRALNDDQQYSWTGQAVGDEGWHDTLFKEEGWYGAISETSGQQDSSSDFEYRNPPQLPVPKPIGKTLFHVWGENGEGAVPDVGPGRFLLVKDSGGTDEQWGVFPTVGNIIHVYDMRVLGNVQLAVTSTLRTPALESLLGWFEVVRTFPGDIILVRRVDDIDPVTGRAFYGQAQLLSLDQTVPPIAGEGIKLEATVHAPIQSLWTGTYYDVDAVETARVTNIIDPNWTGHSLKGVNNGFYAKADRAIFDTTYDSTTATHADPGNLLDLGFRMVFFPAKIRLINIPDPVIPTNFPPPWAELYQSVEVIVPDFDNPIASNEVVLDPSKLNEKQYIEVDYSNGLVYLSHPVKPGSPLYNAAVLSSVDNPRGETVIFASCVPYSREPGQLGSGVRVTGGAPINSLDIPCLPQGSEYETSDVYGARTTLTFAPAFANVVNSQRGDALLSLIVSGSVIDQIPSSGFVEVLSGVSAQGEPVFQTSEHRGSLFGYYALLENGGNTYLFGRYGGGVAADTVTFDSTNVGVVIPRRDVTLPNSLDGVAGTPFQYDTTYGHAKRSGTLRFGDSELRHNADGSISVIPRETIPKSIQDSLGDMFSNWSLVGGEVTATSSTFTMAPFTYLYNGIRRVVPTSSGAFFRGGADQVGYVCWDTATCSSVLASSLPVAATRILLAKLDIPPIGPLPTVVTDLRNPMTDLDKRLDLFVGEASGQTLTHFETLREAVDYASELMTPAVGDLGFSLRIKIVGTTTELGVTTSPITIKTDGLVIEGNGKRDASGTGYVRWGANAPLIDLNGCSNVQFRGVGFQNFHAPGTTVAHVFTNSGVSTGTVIEDCTTLDEVNDLVNIVSNVTPMGLISSRICNNVGTLVGDMVNVSGTAVLCSNLKIEHNSFGTSAGIITNAGVHIYDNICGDVSVAGSSRVCRNSMATLTVTGLPGEGRTLIEGNEIRDANPTAAGAVLILAGGDGHSVIANEIGGSLEVSAGNGHFIRGNNVGTSTLGRIFSGASDNLVIHGNRIAGTLMNFLGVPKLTGMDLTGGSGHSVADNWITMQHHLAAAVTKSIFKGNQTGLLIVGADCVVADNIVTYDAANRDDITINGTGCTVVGNHCHDILPNPDPEVAGGKITPVIGNRVSGTIFGAAITGGLYTGNEV